LHEQTFQGWAYIRLGILALKKERDRRAQNALDNAMFLAGKYPENAQLLNSIAWELAINDIRLDDALILAQKAVRCAPEDGNIWDTLGEVYARRGNYAEAVKAETKAVELTDGYREFQEKLEKWKRKLGD
jgi:tetratricopeptide (TPR) repeat protein